ncbi:hypothetical protein [Halobacillus sp. Marseille-Q1614]|uniref:hypothetical protein n=1 Tax=Halobacillus sp. Marseille-Q1614 TaxID=2709134 RepID=UPI00156F4519|nr:hypothetical protein [Halobacillus sp. Marseille-Q1614]
MSAYDNYRRIYELEQEVEELKRQLEGKPVSGRDEDDYLLMLILMFIMLDVDFNIVTNLLNNGDLMTEAIEVLGSLNLRK